MDGVRRPGFLISLSIQDGLEWQPVRSGPARVDAAEVVSVDLFESVAAMPGGGAQINLMDGGRLFGDIGGAIEDTLELESPLLGTLKIPLEHVAAIITEKGRNQIAAGTLASMIRRADRSSDELWFVNGDRLRGSLVSVGRKTVSVATESGLADAPTDVLLGVFLANPPPRPSAALRAVIGLTDTSELTVDDLNWYGQNVQVAGDGWLKVSFPSHVVTDVQIIGGRWRWLGELTPTEFNQHSLTGKLWPYRVDANVLDQPMRIGGTRYRHGIGLHSAANLVYYLGGKYDVFSAQVGIDDSAGPLADADLFVRIDSQPGFQARGLRSGQKAIPVRLDVRGAQRLEISVEFGRNADIQDRVNVADAALIRTTPGAEASDNP